MSYFEFPHTRSYEGDLGYIIHRLNELNTRYNNFFRYNFIHFHDPIDWDITTQYEAWAMVYDTANGNLMISIQPVPKGINITNTDFWQLVSPFKCDDFFNINSVNPVTNRTITAKFNSLDALNEALNLAIETETNERQNADTSLSARISSLSDDLTTETNTRETAVNDLTTSLNNEISTRLSADSTLSARIDAIASLPEGSTSGDAELIDIRTGANGVTYANAGDAVRSQIELVEHDIDFVSKANGVSFANDTNMFYSELVTGKFLYYSSGVEGENATWNYFRFVPVNAGILYYTNLPYMWVCYYDEDKQYLSGEERINTYSFTPPTGAKFVQVSYDTTRALRYNTTYPAMYVKYEFVPFDRASYIKNLNANIGLGLDNLSGIITHGKNLFNKNSLVNGFYLSWTTGYTVGENADYYTCFDYIDCIANTTYISNNSNCVICEYDEDKNFIAGHNMSGSSVNTFTTAINTKYLRVSCSESAINLLQIEAGSVSTTYEPFKYIFTTDISRRSDNTIIVATDGTGDYTTIAEAVLYAVDGNTIYIKNGSYNEAIDCRSKFLNFVGESKDKVIWSYPNGDYQNPPLEIAKGTVSNLTILATAQELQPGAIAKAYSVHIDFNDSIGEYLAFNNVKFINEDYQTIGIGLRANFTLEFTNCEFICKANNNAFYCHDSVVESVNQNVILRNCTFTTSGIAYAIHLQSQEVAGSSAFVTFQRCIVVNESADNIIKMSLFNPSIGGGGYLNSTDWQITKQSLLNSNSLMNYS